MKSTRLSSHGFQEISLVWYVYLGSISVLWELVWIRIWDFFWKSLESSQTECPLLQKHTECTNIFQRNPISLILKSTRGFLANKMYFLPIDPEKKKFYQAHFEKRGIWVRLLKISYRYKIKQSVMHCKSWCGNDWVELLTTF